MRSPLADYLVFSVAVLTRLPRRPPWRLMPMPGPLFDSFSLTMAPGSAPKLLGPLFYSQTTQDQRTWAIPPLFSHTENPDPDIRSEEFDFVYPVLTYSRFGKQYRWQFFQLLSFSGGHTQTETNRDRFTIFPVFFQQRSSDPAENYTAVFPIYGRMLRTACIGMKSSLWLFPLYSKTRKKDVVTDNYLYPFFHTAHGDGLRGWQFWPLVGHEHKEVTTRTNGLATPRPLPATISFFALWPIYLPQYVWRGHD